MKHLKKFNQFLIKESIDEILQDKIRDEFNYSRAYANAEIEVAQSYDWEDTDRWCECENESDWISSYDFAEREVDDNIVDQILQEFDIEDTEENREIVESLVEDMRS